MIRIKLECDFRDMSIGQIDDEITEFVSIAPKLSFEMIGYLNARRNEIQAQNAGEDRLLELCHTGK